jgi:hypothetical protein
MSWDPRDGKISLMALAFGAVCAAAIAAVQLAAGAHGAEDANAADVALCNDVPDAGRPQFIIGYGSLMQAESRARTNPGAGAPLPVVVQGYARGWFEPDDAPAFGTTYLGVRMRPSAHLNAIAYAVDDVALAQADRRESGYCRREVSLESVKAMTLSPRIPEDAQLWIYVTDYHGSIYPRRPFVYQPRARQIDTLLHDRYARHFDRMRIEGMR